MVGTLCTLKRARSDRFEGPSEASSRVLIFPLFYRGGGRLRAGHGSVNGCRLGPPESDKTAQTGPWRIRSSESDIPGSERNGRLLHNFFDQKMISECTIFAYTIMGAFLQKSSFRASRSGGPTHHFELAPPKAAFCAQKSPFGHFASK